MFQVLNESHKVIATRYSEGACRRFIQARPLDSTYLVLPNGTVEAL